MPTEEYHEGTWSGLPETENIHTPIGGKTVDDGHSKEPGKGNTDEQTQNVGTNTEVKNEIRPRTKLERLIDKIAGGNSKVTPKTKIERLLERISSRLDKIESGAASGDVLKSAIKNSGIGYVAPGEALIENAQCTEEGPVYVSPAVITLVPNENLTLHVSIPELGIDEDMTAKIGQLHNWYVEKLYNEGESSEYAIVVSVTTFGTSNGFYCEKMAGKTGQKSLPVFSISMPGEERLISPDMIAGQFLPEVTADDDGMVLGVSNGVWDKVDAPSGGADVFRLAITDKKDESDNTCTANHTLAEIKAAHNAGNIIEVAVQRHAGNNSNRYFVEGYMKWTQTNYPYVFVVDCEQIDGTNYLVFLTYYGFGDAVGSAVTRKAYKVAVSTYIY